MSNEYHVRVEAWSTESVRADSEEEAREKAVKQVMSRGMDSAEAHGVAGGGTDG